MSPLGAWNLISLSSVRVEPMCEVTSLWVKYLLLNCANQNSWWSDGCKLLSCSQLQVHTRKILIINRQPYFLRSITLTILQSKKGVSKEQNLIAFNELQALQLSLHNFISICSGIIDKINQKTHLQAVHTEGRVPIISAYQIITDQVPPCCLFGVKYLKITLVHSLISWGLDLGRRGTHFAMAYDKCL